MINEAYIRGMMDINCLNTVLFFYNKYTFEYSGIQKMIIPFDAVKLGTVLYSLRKYLLKDIQCSAFSKDAGVTRQTSSFDEIHV